jgi:hypothetical protein
VGQQHSTDTITDASKKLPAGVSEVAESLIAASIQAALAAIEIYNKPVFSYREQAFTILLINAWESLCKAKLVADAQGDVQVLYVAKPDGTFKTGRSGNFLTIELSTAMNRLSLVPAVLANISSLIEIRDTATHLYTDSAVQQVVHSLGVAALQNYHRLMTAWFGNRLGDYKFQIMPLAFTYDFRTLAVLALDQNANEVGRLLQLVIDSHAASPASGGFHFICEIAAEIRSVKKLSEKDGFVATPDNSSASGLPVVLKTQSLVDKYPLSYVELRGAVQLERPGTKPAQIDRIIRDCKIKANTAFAAYNFRTKAHREKYDKNKSLPKDIAVIYNADAVRFIVNKLDDGAPEIAPGPEVVH